MMTRQDNNNQHQTVLSQFSGNVVTMASGGGKHGCYQFLKYLILAVNTLLMVMSLTLIVCINIYFVMMKKGSQLDPDFPMAAVLGFLLAVPVFCMIVSFLGCFGALNLNKCLLITYSVIVGLLVALFVVAFVLVQVYKSKFDALSGEISKKVKDSLKPGSVWDFFQSKLHCCGVDDYKDWKTANETLPIPSSCYGPGKDNSTVVPTYTRGCANILQTYISNYTHVFLGCLFGLAVFMVIFISAAYILLRTISSYTELELI